MLSLLAGKPNEATFPFSSISMTLKPIVPGGPEETLVIESKALGVALQYGPTAGLSGLVKWLSELEESRHKRPQDGSWRVSVGSGSQDLIYKVSAESWVSEGVELIELGGGVGLPGSHRRGRQYPARDASVPVSL